MLTAEQAQAFAGQWIRDWNSRDLGAILSHYSEDVCITTPMIKLATGVDTGRLEGKMAVARYWANALERLPELHFELLDVAAGVDSVALYYRSVLDKLAIEVMFLGPDGKVREVVAHYR